MSDPLDRQVVEIIEGLRVACSEHRDADWKLGAIYALDTVKPLLRAALASRQEAQPNFCTLCGQSNCVNHGERFQQPRTS
jgi:hypothetical protein